MVTREASSPHQAPDATANRFIEKAIEQVQRLGSSQETSQLFPNGLKSLELDLVASDGTRVSLKLASNDSSSTEVTAPGTDSPIFVGKDVQATFNAEGHHVVALIARADLQQRLPATMAKVQKILDNGGRDLLAAATFPDDIRSSHPETKPFHFIDIEFETGGPAIPPLPPAPTVISKIADFTAAIKRGGTPKDLIDPLSWLIHLVGDIHQPLHCITHISSLHPRPDGDRGGNSFALRGHARNLHSLWDSSVSFTAESEDQIASDILQEHTRTELAADLRETDTEQWARSSFNLAKQFAYAPLHENPSSPPKPTAQYLANTLKVGRRQAALAGYRLADRLQEVFD